MPTLVRKNFLLAFDLDPPVSSSAQEYILFIPSSLPEQSSTSLPRLSMLFLDKNFTLSKKKAYRFLNAVCRSYRLTPTKNPSCPLNFMHPTGKRNPALALPFFA